MCALNNTQYIDEYSKENLIAKLATILRIGFDGTDVIEVKELKVIVHAAFEWWALQECLSPRGAYELLHKEMDKYNQEQIDKYRKENYVRFK
jgi:hypothetical protein